MTKKLLETTVFFKRIKLLEAKKELYRTVNDVNNKVEYQIKTFNKVWSEAQKIPFYKKWKEENKLPDEIKSPDDLKKFPKLTKKDIQNNQELIFKNLANYSIMSTGGSTGQPMKFPTSKEEKNIEYATTYLGRSWWGINPLDEMIIYWGHSHLFGSGLVGKINHIKRIFSDWLINLKRFNAYDMTANTLQVYYQKLVPLNPTSITGYTSLNYKLSKFINENTLSLGKKSNLKGIICTSESISDNDINVISKAFNKPVILEYGMAECSVIGYSKEATRNIEIFWDNFLCITTNDNVLCISTLYDRKFPLINYQTDDVVKVVSEQNGSIFTISHIQGRKQISLYLKTFDNTEIYDLSGILMVHILKSYPHIYTVNFEQLTDNQMKINLTSDIKLDLSAIKTYFCNELRNDHPKIDENAIFFMQNSEESRTLAGKEKLI